MVVHILLCHLSKHLWTPSFRIAVYSQVTICNDPWHFLKHLSVYGVLQLVGNHGIMYLPKNTLDDAVRDKWVNFAKRLITSTF